MLESIGIPWDSHFEDWNNFCETGINRVWEIINKAFRFLNWWFGPRRLKSDWTTRFERVYVFEGIPNSERPSQNTQQIHWVIQINGTRLGEEGIDGTGNEPLSHFGILEIPSL